MNAYVYFRVMEMAALRNTVNLEIINQFNDAVVTGEAPPSSDDHVLF